jgi:DNA-binding XRE family transcriptional regulator
MTDGGENGPAMTGFENINSVITPETLRLITSDIKSGTMKQSELAIKYSVSKATIERITYGTVYKLEGEVYPLRTTRLIQDEVEQIIYMLYNSDLSFKKIGQYFNRDANLISEINLGNIYKQSNTIYPIKEGKICRNTYLNILMELENGLGPVVIGKKVGVAKDTVVLIRKNRNYRYNY